MAEAVILPVVADLLSYLGSTTFREIALSYGVKEELDKIKDTFSAMQAVLLDAEQKADVSNAVKDWLGKLNDAAYDVDDLLDELSYENLRRKVNSRDKIAKKNMDSLKGLWKPRKLTPKDACQSFLLPSFHCLSSLWISGCPEFISTLLHAEDDARWEALDVLRLKGLPKLASLPEHLRHSTALQSLSIIDCNNLLTLPD